MQKKHQSLLAGTQKIKSWHSESSSMLANNELNKWALLSNVLGEGGTQRKHSVSPNAATLSTWTTVQFLLLFVGLWFQQMDRAVLIPHEKQRGPAFLPFAAPRSVPGLLPACCSLLWLCSSLDPLLSQFSRRHSCFPAGSEHGISSGEGLSRDSKIFLFCQ